MRNSQLALMASVAGLLAIGGGAAASQPGSAIAGAARPTVVYQRVAVPGTNRQLGVGLAVFAPYSSKPHQEATGPEICYVLQGEVTVRIEGKPPAIYREGQTWRMPAFVLHQTTAGPEGAKVLASWVDVPGMEFNIAVPGRR